MKSAELIKQLRTTTAASMKDCVDALKEANNDFDAAVDIIKIKGKNIVAGREGRVAAEGLVLVCPIPYHNDTVAMIEINCQTDFVARSDSFNRFAYLAAQELTLSFLNKSNFDVNIDKLLSAKEQLVSSTKEAINIRRWWIEEAVSPLTKVFCYSHPGKQLAVILTINVGLSDGDVLNHPEFLALGNDLAMQVAAMNPVAISSDTISDEIKNRQQNIFETQLKEAGKPVAVWEKIMIGKFQKYYSEFCLLEQESVVVPKKSVKSVIADLEKKLSCKIEISNMIRCQIGEGLVVEKSNLADEVARLSNVHS